MARTSPDVHDALIKAGIDRAAVDELMRRLERRSGPSAMSILIGAVIGGFGLLAIGIGWVKTDVQAVDTRLSSVETGLSESISSLEAKMSERISSLEVATSERLTRIETLLNERLPARQ